MPRLSMPFNRRSPGKDDNSDKEDEAREEGCTGVNTSVNSEMISTFEEEAEAEEEERRRRQGGRSFEVGDHIYSWQKLGTYQHHGIVVSSSKVLVTVLDFFPIKHDDESSGSSSSSPDDCHAPQHMQTPTTAKVKAVSLEEWTATNGTPHKVQYSASWLSRTVYRSGTCTAAPSDPPWLISARIQFLLQNEDILPSPHALHANSENVAVWCKTGRWTTLQVYDFLHLTAAGQLKSAGSLGMYVANHTVTVPASGVWGYLGFTTKATMASTQPYLLPLIAGYGLVTVGGPIYMLRKCQGKWNATTQDLNDGFWASANNEVIVDCILHWSGLVDGDDK